MEDEDIIVAKSPLGYTVCCSRHQWDTHIIPGHPEMKGRELEVQAAIEHPHKVFQSSSDAKRHAYYSNPVQRMGKPEYTKVVTGPTNYPNIQDVITAYSAKTISEERRGGVLLHGPTEDTESDI